MKKFVLLLIPLNLMLTCTAYAQPLDSLLRMAVEENAQLKALMLEYEAKREEANQVNQLPQPQAGVGIPILPPETRLGPQLLTVSVSQLFPWFGTLSAKEDVVVTMSETRFHKIAAEKLNLFYAVKSNYYQLQFIYQQYTLLEEDIQLLRTLEELSLAKVGSGQGSIANVLRIQLEIEGQLSKIEVLENKKNAISAQINELIRKPLTQEIIPDTHHFELPTLAYDLDAFRESIAQHHPLMEMLHAEIEASKQRDLVNLASNKPSIGVGVDYSIVGQRTDSDPINNGRDILIPKVMLQIPIYRKSFNATNRIEELKRESLEWEKTALTDRLTRELIQYKTDYDNALVNI